MMKRLLWAVLLTPLCALAQVPPAADPGAIQQRQIEEEMRRREAERERRKAVEPLKREAPARPALKPDAAAVRFLVREIEFSPSEILSAAELEEVARDFRGRQVSLAELQQLAERINALYRAKNVVTAQAVIPPQDVSAGIVRVRLIEGRVGRIEIRGNATTDTDFILARLGLKPQELVDLDRLEPALVRFNRTNDAPLRAELKPGTEFATTDLLIDIAEPPRHDLRLTLDNHGSAATGEWRTTLAYLNRSLLGFRDDLSLSYTDASGQTSQSFGYGFPVNTWGGRVNFTHNNDETAIVNGPLKPLHITGEAVGWGLGLRQPLHVDNELQLDLAAGLRKRHSANWIGGVFLQRTDYNERSLGVEFQRFDGGSHWFASLTRHFVTATVTAADPVSLAIDRGSVRYSRELAGGLSLRGNLAWQDTAQKSLPSGELFFIGGEGRVRGYPVGAYSGDTGHALNLELHHPLWAASADTAGIGASGAFFIDYGRVRPFRPPASTLPEHERLAGAGWTLLAAAGQRVQARLTFATGLKRDRLREHPYEVTLQLIASAF